MKKKLILIMLLIFALTVTLASCTNDEKKVSELTVIEDTITKEYTVGDTPDFSGIKAVISYSDGTAETVGSDKLTVGAIDTSTPGEKQLSVKFGNFEKKITITVTSAPTPVTLESISIISGTVATEIYIGDSLDTSKLQAEALYSDGTKKFITASGLTIGQIDTANVGDKDLTVSYTENGVTKSATVKIKVSGIASITVVEGTLGKLYNVGETIDTSAIEVIVTYQNGKSETLGASKISISAPATDEMGEKDIVIRYRGAETVYKVMVRGVTSITINPGSVASEVKIGTPLDVTGITAKANFNNGDELPLLNSQLSIQNVDTSTAGLKQLIVRYGSAEAAVSVKVYGVKEISVNAGTVASSVKLGETLDTSGIIAIIVYGDENETRETVDASKLTFGSIDTSEIGDKTLSVSYLDKTAELTVTVKAVTGIEINENSVNNKVIVFGTLDTSKITATAIYSNGDRETIPTSELTASTVSTAKAGEETLTVSYGSFSDTMTVKVFGVKTMMLHSGTYAREVLVGEVYSVDNVTVTVTLDDGSDPFDVYAEDLEFVIPSTDGTGTELLKITYLDRTLTLGVNVCGIVGIVVEGYPQVVVEGEEPDLSGMKVYAKYGDSKKTEVLITEGYTTNIDDLDFSIEGDKELIVTYGDFTAVAIISTTPPILTNIVLDKYTSLIGIGNAYSTSDVTAIAHYDNGSTRRLTEADLTITAPSTDTAGAKTLAVSFTDNGVTVSAEAEVTVLKITSLTVSGISSKVDIFFYNSYRLLYCNCTYYV